MCGIIGHVGKKSATRVLFEGLRRKVYYIAVTCGCDVDKPRNLAKCVTVE